MVAPSAATIVTDRSAARLSKSKPLKTLRSVPVSMIKLSPFSSSVAKRLSPAEETADAGCCSRLLKMHSLVHIALLHCRTDRSMTEAVISGVKGWFAWPIEVYRIFSFFCWLTVVNRRGGVVNLSVLVLNWSNMMEVRSQTV